MKIRTLSLTVGLLVTVPAWALEGPAPATATNTTPTLASPAPAQATHGKDLHLGKIQVTGLKPLVETLQQIKLAVKRPFDNDPAHFDDMVCRLGADEIGSHTSSTLECGTQGWFSMRRNSYGGPSLGAAMFPASTLGHPWHVVRALNSKQLMVLRELLKELPPPGQGQVEVVDDTQAPLEPSH